MQIAMIGVSRMGSNLDKKNIVPDADHTAKPYRVLPV